MSAQALAMRKYYKWKTHNEAESDQQAFEWWTAGHNEDDWRLFYSTFMVNVAEDLFKQLEALKNDAEQSCIKCSRRPICRVFTNTAFSFHNLPSSLFHGNVVDITEKAWDEIFESLASCCKKFTHSDSTGIVTTCFDCDNENLCHYWIKIKEQLNGTMDKAVPYSRIADFVSASAKTTASYCKASRPKVK